MRGDALHLLLATTADNLRLVAPPMCEQTDLNTVDSPTSSAQKGVDMKSRMTTSTLLTASLFVAPLAVAGVPHEIGPAKNGRISFGRFDPQLGDFSLWSANRDGTQQRRLTNSPTFMSDWSPDGGRIAFDFADDTGMHVATIASDGGDRHQLTTGAGIQEDPKWSLDGKWITTDASPVLPDDPSFFTSIWVMRADGSLSHQMTTDGFDVEPVFSPDGSHIAFGRITGGTDEGQLEAVYVVNTDGTNLHQVVPPILGLEHPDWSPDGQWITFNIAPESISPDAGAVVAVHPNGHGQRILRSATERYGFFKPVWSPDGRQFLVGCHDRQEHVDKLCEMDADGDHVHVVVDAGPYPVNFPAWGPR